MRYIISLLLASALPAQAEVPRVMTDIPPVHALVAQVMGDLGQPQLLLDPGASEHDFQLRPSQAADLAEAGLIVWIGPDLTPWLDRAVDGLGPDTPSLTLLNAAGTVTQDYAETGADPAGHGDHADHGAETHEAHEAEAHADEAHADEAHEGHEDHAAEAAQDHDHDHAHEGKDPHAWLDPGNAKVWLGVIAAELARIDPDNAAAYSANAAAAQTALDALESEIAATLKPAQGVPLVTAHDAYGYFAGHFGLTLAGSAALGDATSPGAKRLSALEDRLRATPGTCIFPEHQHDPALLLQLAEATGARVGAPLDPNGSTLEPGPDAYAALLRGLATAIAACAAT